MSLFCKVIFSLIGCSANALAQSSYPVIDKDVQQARDQERNLILDAELLAEYQGLAKATSDLAASPTQELADRAHRHRENINALQRELGKAEVVQKSSNVPLRVTVKAARPARLPSTYGAATGATYWNPYNRAIDAGSPNDSSTAPRRDAP